MGLGRSTPRLGQKLECEGSLQESDKFFMVRFCPPEEQEFLDRLEITKEEWNELFVSLVESSYVLSKVFFFLS